MLRLFAGRENIDKERFIYDRIKEVGGEAFVLVPNQYTLAAEKQALKYLGAECLFDVEILSMNRLGLRILQEQGTESVKMLSKYGRFMLLNLIIREHEEDFEIFANASCRQGFASMLNDFISEFKQQDCSLDEIDEMLGESGDDPILRAKLRELKGVIEEYNKAIDGSFIDSEDYISRYIDAIKDSKLVRGKNFWIYGYDSITPKFADAVAELADVAESVNIIVNRNDFGLDEHLTVMLRRLLGERGSEISLEEIDEKEYATEKSETISRIERSLWKDVIGEDERAANKDFVPEDLTMVSAANPYYEAESAACYVWHLVRDLGYRMNEIQLIANDEGAMQPVVKRVFAEYGLPVFSDATRDITSSAAVGFIINLLKFVSGRKQTPYLFAMLKSGLSDFEDSAIEELENYAGSYRIKGSMWDKPFEYGAGEIGEDRLAALNEMRSTISEKAVRLAEIAKKTKVSEFTEGFKKYLEDEWQLGQKVEAAAKARDDAGLHDEAQRMLQSYQSAMDILSQIDEIMGGSDTDFAEFCDIYEAGLSDVEVGVIPPTIDGLSLGTMIRTRPQNIRAVIIMGANEGVTPLSPKTEGLFSVDEKEYFKTKGFALGRLDDIKMDEENAAMYRMMSKPAEKLYISWSLSNAEGGEANPSPIIYTLRDLFPRIDSDGLIKKDLISEGFSESLFNEASDGLRHLINRLKERDAEGKSEDLLKAALHWYSDNREADLDVMLDAASYDNNPRPLERTLAKDLFARYDGNLSLSASSIDTYVGCPFRYYVDKGLRPKELNDFTSDPRSVGDVYHECLMAVARQIMGDEKIAKSIAEGSDSELETMVGRALDEIASSYRGGLFISTGNEEYRMDRIREICAAAAKAMASQLTASSMKEAFFEEKFGREAAFEPIELEVGGEKVYVEGKIDRADIIEADGKDRVRIIDYKTGSDKLDTWKMRQGLKMQLAIYLISASSGKEPAGMFYFNISDPIQSANDKSKNVEEKIIASKPEDEFKLKGAFIDEAGVLDAMPKKVLSSDKGKITREDYDELQKDVLARIEETASGILEGKIGINPIKDDNRLVCNYCNYKSICRRDRGYVKNAARTIKPKPKENKEAEGGREE